VSPPPPTLRALLAQSPPRFRLRQAWPALIRGLRRAPAPRDPLASRAALERALAQAPLPRGDLDDCLAALKAELRAIAGGEGDPAAAAAAIRGLLPSPVEGPVRLCVEGWPPSMPAADRARLLGGEPEASWAAAAAAAAIARVNGLEIAGVTLRARATLPPGCCLPPLPRAARRRPGPRGRPGPWLEVDDQGRYSLTPEHIARDQAALLGGLSVVDAYCGCGGDAIAAAEAGCRVTAVERDAGRLELARRNARRRGVAGRIRWIRGDALEQAARLLRADPAAALYLDPPWGGPGETPRAFGALLPGWGPLVAAAARVVIKAPRVFDPATRPTRPGGWAVRYAFGARRDDADVVKLLTLFSPAASSSPPTPGRGR